MEDRLLAAIKAGDTAALEAILHGDLLFMVPDGQIITKEMDLASHRSGNMIVKELHSTIEKIILVKDIAIVVVVYETRGTMMGNPIDGRFRYIRFWKNFPEGIKVIGGSCLKL